MKCIACGKTIPNGSPFCNRCGARQNASSHLPATPARPELRAKHTRAANGQGTVVRRGKTWTACVTRYIYLPDPDNPSVSICKRLTKSKGGFRTKTDARQACTQLSEALDKASLPKKNYDATLAHYFVTVERDYLPSLSLNKQRQYKKAWRDLSPLSSIPIREITVNTLCDFVASACKTRTDIVSMKAVLFKIFRLAAADGLTSKDLPSFIKVPPQPKTDRDAFSREECLRIFDLWNAGNTFSGYILLMIATGMMPGELRALKKDMVDLDNHIIQGVGMKTEQRKTQAVILPQVVLPILRFFLETVPGDFVCPYRTTDTFNPRYYKTLEEANCRRLVPYCCRHTTQTILALDSTVSISQAARILRHSIKMAETYTHVSDTEASSTSGSFSAFLHS